MFKSYYKEEDIAVLLTDLYTLARLEQTYNREAFGPSDVRVRNAVIWYGFDHCKHYVAYFKNRYPGCKILKFNVAEPTGDPEQVIEGCIDLGGYNFHDFFMQRV